MCQDSKNCNCNGSSFIFGLFLGLLAAALVAILLYKKDKKQILNKLQKKFHDLFDNLPKSVSPQAPVASKPKPKPKLFRQAK